MNTIEAAAAASPMSEQERAKVREQMNRLLETHHFKNSRRYPALLRFIVEETLEGRGEFLKERLLGVRVFDRPADYDTATDPIVRVTIAEIRKRIAQYYHDEEHDAEIRIELLPGRYAPEFRARRESPEPGHPAGPDRSPNRLHDRPLALEAAMQAPLAGALLAADPALDPTIASPARPQSAKRNWSNKSWFVWGAAAGLLLTLGSVFGARLLHRSALDQLWAPIARSDHAVLFCLPTDIGRQAILGQINEVAADGQVHKVVPKITPAPLKTFLDHENLGENVVYSDMLATLSISNILTVYHRDYRVRLNTSTTLDDLRHGPSILIGGLDNEWTMRALAPLRFHFAGSDNTRYWVADTTNAAFKDWSLDLKQQYPGVTRDYAIVARLHSEQTGQPEMIAAGIGMSGTAAAGEFLADEHRVEELRQKIGAGFQDRDFEAVLSTDVVNGVAGSARILAVAVW